MGRFVHGLARERRGATAIEYGLILALVALTIVGGIATLGGGMAGLWQNNMTRITQVLS